MHHVVTGDTHDIDFMEQKACTRVSMSLKVPAQEAYFSGCRINVRSVVQILQSAHSFTEQVYNGGAP